MPHEFVGQWLNQKFDKDIRRNYFRGMQFAEPKGDPGWFGPAARCGTSTRTCTR